MRGMIHIAPSASATDGDCTLRRTDPRVFDRCEINHQTVVANSETACVVAATTDRKKQIVFACEIYRQNDVCDIDTPRDQPRLFVDHRVIDVAGVIVICVARLDQSSTQVCFEIGDRIFVEHDGLSLKPSCGQHVESHHFR